MSGTMGRILEMPWRSAQGQPEHYLTERNLLVNSVAAVRLHNEPTSTSKQWAVLNKIMRLHSEGEILQLQFLRTHLFADCPYAYSSGV